MRPGVAARTACRGFGPSVAGAEQTSALFGSFAVGPVGYLGALAIAFMIAVMTAVTSRLTVYRYLADTE